MTKNPNILQNWPETHFLLCTERTGSSLLSLMMNLHSNVVCPSEEPFALFFHRNYKNKTHWTDKELLCFIDEFWLIAEKNLDLFFTSKQKLFDQLVIHKNNLNYKLLCTIIYLQFFEPKPKENIRAEVAIERHRSSTSSTLETSPSVKRKICRARPCLGECSSSH